MDPSIGNTQQLMDLLIIVTNEDKSKAGNPINSPLQIQYWINPHPLLLLGRATLDTALTLPCLLLDSWIIVLKWLSLFEIETKITLERSVWADFSWSLSKTNRFNCFMTKSPRKKNSGQNLKFCGIYFLFHLLNWVIQNNMERNTVVTLQFEDRPCSEILLLFKKYLLVTNLKFFNQELSIN